MGTSLVHLLVPSKVVLGIGLLNPLAFDYDYDYEHERTYRPEPRSTVRIVNSRIFRSRPRLMFSR